MPQRGSAQLLLLLFSRPYHRVGRTVGAIVGTAFIAVVVLSGIEVSGLAPGELVHLARQSAWDRALTGSPESTPWPWTATSNRIASAVPRLGLSASLVHDGRGGDRSAANGVPWLTVDEARNGPAATLDTMTIGDRITLTTAGGDSRVYRVIGRKIVDPHLAEADFGTVGSDAPTCRPRDTASTLQLIIQAITNEPPAAEPKEQQKL